MCHVGKVEFTEKKDMFIHLLLFVAAAAVTVGAAAVMLVSPEPHVAAI